jgi:hypothetical protein
MHLMRRGEQSQLAGELWSGFRSSHSASQQETGKE